MMPPMETWDISTHDVRPHQPEVLRTTDESRVIAVNLPAGEALDDHQVHERAFVAVVTGRVEVEAGGETVSGGTGLLAHFDPNERHEVRAVEDARLILFLAPWPGEGHPSQR
jgi:quercetin dioxygenase-like cupin family protein